MEGDLFAPIRNLLSLSSREELPYLGLRSLLHEEGPSRHQEPPICTLP